MPAATPPDATPPSQFRLQHVLGACFGALALGMVAATLLGVWLDAPGGPVRIPAPHALVPGGCAMPQSVDKPTDYIGVPCDDPRATSLVLELTMPAEPSLAVPRCPFGTDELVEIYSPPLSEATGESASDGESASEPEVVEIACMRNLFPDHPGDPGAGGGQLIAGDCGYIDAEDAVAETPCNPGDTDEVPQFQVLELVGDPIDCPEATTVKFELSPDLSFGEDGYLMVCGLPYGAEK